MFNSIHRPLRSLVIAMALTIAWPVPAAERVAAHTVVLVHGAFADGSSWSAVIPRLRQEGLEVIAVQLPLTSLADDAAATRRAIERAGGPVTLVGHSWGGTVITAAGRHDSVQSLVYIAAFANEDGASVNDLLASQPHAAGLAEVVVDTQGFARLSTIGVSRFLVPELSPQAHTVIDATQGPVRAASFGEKISAPAWQVKPSWYLVTENDQLIAPVLQQAMASHIGAYVRRIRAGHAVPLTRPEVVAELILESARAGQAN